MGHCESIKERGWLDRSQICALANLSVVVMPTKYGMARLVRGFGVRGAYRSGIRQAVALKTLTKAEVLFWDRHVTQNCLCL